jgi:hypothetical protein
MRVSAKVMGITLLLMLAAVAANAQKRELKINQALTERSAVSGQLVELKLEGIADEMMRPIPVEKFEVLVRQNGETHKAKVRSASQFMILATMIPKASPAPSDSIVKAVEEEGQVDGMKHFQTVMFTVPQKLVEGEASVQVKYRGQKSDEFKFNLVSRPPTPKIFVFVKTATSAPKTMSKVPNLEKSRAPRLTFERGRETELEIKPLIDPETPDSAVLVSFRQGTSSYEATAKVTRHEGVEPTAGSIMFAPPRYEVTVKAPEGLLAGEVQVEVRIRVNGQTSEAGSIGAVITDAASGIDNPADVAPLITNIDRSSVGVGQAFYLSVSDSQKLGPEPSKTLVILEQDGRRVELKPESNSAIRFKSQGLAVPAMLLVRVGRELTGKVSVKVYNPERGEQMGMSAGVPIEITDEVQPPAIETIAEASKQEIALLKSLREQALKAGYDFKEYDADSRYVAIQATDLDPNPNFLRVQFEQGGEKYILKFSDFSLTANGRNIVRLPAAIKPGEVRVSIQNIGAGRLSKAVTYTFEVTQIGFSR